MEIVAATNNAGKLKELRRILEPMGYTLLTPADLGLNLDPEETGTTFEANALIKAEAFCKAAGKPVIADDSGLTVEALEYDDYVTALQNGNYDLYYGEVRLSPDFDLSVFFGENAALGYGGITDSALALLCAQARENEGNAYNLYEKVMERGVLCPVLFKTYAVYSQRGRVTGLTPCLDGVFLQPIPEKRP